VKHTLAALAVRRLAIERSFSTWFHNVRLASFAARASTLQLRNDAIRLRVPPALRPVFHPQ
jgi:hypothetical protein